MRQRIEDGYIAIMMANLADAKRAGQLADWAVPEIVARHMFAQYIAGMIAWGLGELDLPGFRGAALSGVCHLLAGVARGARKLPAPGPGPGASRSRNREA